MPYKSKRILEEELPQQKEEEKKGKKDKRENKTKEGHTLQI